MPHFQRVFGVTGWLESALAGARQRLRRWTANLATAYAKSAFGSMQGYRVFALLCLCTAMLIMPLFGVWLEPQLVSWTAAASWMLATAGAAILLSLVLSRGSLLFVGVGSFVVCAFHTGAMLVTLDESPYALAVLGASPLATGIVVVNELDRLFPRFGQRELARWFQVAFTGFAIFISASMVGFTLAWYQSIPALVARTADSEARARFFAAKRGINTNLLIMLYSWCGMAAVAYYAFRKLYGVRPGPRTPRG